MKNLLVFLLAVFSLSCKKVKVEKFIFPYGYKGNAIIVYGQKDGISPLYSKDTIVYEFNNTGILFVKNKQFITNMSYSKYYYKDSSGNLIDLCSYTSNKFLTGCIDTVMNDFNEGYQKNSKSDFINYGIIVIGSKTSRFNMTEEFDRIFKVK